METPAAQPIGPKNVLVVDDSNIMRRLVREIVESDPDLRVIDTAENGKIALQKVRQHRPDVVLLDIEMPELSGLETLRRLGLRSPSKVVILSSLGFEGSAERAEALRLGAADVLDKPSGSVSMDIKSSRGSKIVQTLRRVCGLPLNGESEGEEDALQSEEVAENPAATAQAAPPVSLRTVHSALLNTINSGVVALDIGLNVVYANEIATKLLGRNTAIPIGLPLSQLFGEFNELIADEIREVLATGAEKKAHRVDFSTEDGEWVPFRISIVPAAPDLRKSAALLVTFEDVSAEQALRKVLDRAMSSSVTDAVMSGQNLGLGGKLAQATILFSDVRGFTKLCEGLHPEALVTMMNDYFTFMADVIKGNFGIIDKFIGDAVMALFGVPTSTGKDAENAVQGAIAMLQALELFNSDRLADGHLPFNIGIGLATGEVVAGQLGSPERMNYTVIGNAVNLSSRIESLTSNYGAQLLVCGATFEQLAIPVHSRLIDRVRVKGQQTPTKVHEIFYKYEEAKDGPWLEAFDAAFKLYTAGQFRAALPKFESALECNPRDKACKVFMDRCRVLASTPRADWDGVWSMESKGG